MTGCCGGWQVAPAVFIAYCRWHEHLIKLCSVLQPRGRTALRWDVKVILQLLWKTLCFFCVCFVGKWGQAGRFSVQGSSKDLELDRGGGHAGTLPLDDMSWSHAVCADWAGLLRLSFYLHVCFFFLVSLIIPEETRRKYILLFLL